MEGLKDKRILVTGGTGFVGSHLVETLVKLGATVIVPYRSLDPRSYFSLKKLDKKVIMAVCDLKDFCRVCDIVTKYEVDYIFHLASQAIVTTAFQNPLETLETNIMGTARLLEASRVYGKVKGIIVASSDKAYGKSSKAYRETDPLRGDHPYEVSKSSEDLIAQMYYRTYKLPVVVTRFGNIYGEGDLNFSRIIPGIMKAVIKREKIVLRSDGTYIRDYVHVKDVVSGYLFLLMRLTEAKGEVFNISTNNSYSVTGLIKEAEKIFKRKLPFTVENSARNEIPYQHLNAEKIYALGWKPKYSFKNTFLSMRRWYRLVLE